MEGCPQIRLLPIRLPLGLRTRKGRSDDNPRTQPIGAVFEMWIRRAATGHADSSRSQGKGSAADRTRRGVGQMGTGRRAPAKGGVSGGRPFRPFNRVHVTNTVIAVISTVELPYQSAGATLYETDNDHAESRAEKTSHESNGTATAARRSTPSRFGNNWGLKDLIRLVLITGLLYAQNDQPANSPLKPLEGYAECLFVKCFCPVYVMNINQPGGLIEGSRTVEELATIPPVSVDGLCPAPRRVCQM